MKRSQFELHVWGPLGDIPSFSPDCLAAVWLLYLTVGSTLVNQISIVQSSNTYMSAKGELPVLRHNEQTISGIHSISRYLESMGYVLDGEQDLTPTDRATCASLASYIKTDVSIVTLYSLFIHKENFEQVTSPLLSSLVPFPMQYNLSLSLHDIAKRQCASKGITSTTKPQDNNMVKKHPTLNKLQEQIDSNREARLNLIEGAKVNLKTLIFAEEAYNLILTSTPASNNGLTTANLFGSKWTLADLLLVAHLHIQLYEFPVPVVKTLIQTRFPQLCRYHDRAMDVLNNLHLNIVPVTSDQTPSLLNSILHIIGLHAF